MLENGLSGNLWPVHLKPQKDELLSSWLVRLSMAHGQKLHTFCSLMWSGKPIWNRDIDKSADTEVVQMLSDKTGTPVERVQATTLAAYESILYEKHNHFGPTPWIMPVGVYHRTRTQFGLQYCPRCLAEDRKSYYRRKWRLTFMVLCERHQILLRDRCPKCAAAVNFHREELGHFNRFAPVSLTLCHVCGFDLREMVESTSLSEDNSTILVTPAEVQFTARLLKIMSGGFAQVSEGVATYSHLYFDVLRQLMKVLATQNKRVDGLRHAICKAYGAEPYIPPKFRSHADIQELPIAARRQLLGMVRCLLEEWPYRFIELSRESKVWSSLWLSNLEPRARQRARTAPFWFWSVVHDYLYRARYCPSEEEIRATAKHLKQQGESLNNLRLSRLLGVAVVRRRVVI